METDSTCKGEKNNTSPSSAREKTIKAIDVIAYLFDKAKDKQGDDRWDSALDVANKGTTSTQMDKLNDPELDHLAEVIEKSAFDMREAILWEEDVSFTQAWKYEPMRQILQRVHKEKSSRERKAKAKARKAKSAKKKAKQETVKKTGAAKLTRKEEQYEQH